jgi:hypothetical protein
LGRTAVAGPNEDAAALPPEFEREKWLADLEFRRSELALKERQQSQSEEELSLKKRETERAKWTNPLVVAVFAAAIAGLGNAAATFINGVLQRNLEDSKSIGSLKQTESASESNRVLEMIKTGDTEKAAINLQFLVDTGLVTTPDLSSRLQSYLSRRKAGAGPSLPSPANHLNFAPSPGVASAVHQLVEDNLNKFISYLANLGFPDVRDTVTILINDGEDTQISFTKDERSGGSLISIDQNVCLDVDLPRMVTAYAILEYNKKGGVWGHPYLIEGALVDYFAASLEDRPALGIITAKARGLATPYVYNLDNKRQFSELDPTAGINVTSDKNSDEVWGGAFWEIRGRLGQHAADSVLSETWRALPWPVQDEEVNLQFISSLIARIRNEVSDAHAQGVAEIFRRRGFPL